MAVGFVALDPGASPTGGVPVAAERIDLPDPAAGAVQIREMTPAPPGPATDQVVAAVLTDLNRYWAAVLPTEFDTRMKPLTGGYQAVNSSAATAAGALCIASPAQISGNAYYCPTGDGIVYDSAALVPVLLGHYGAAGLITAFAHEFGHAVQARIGPTVAERAAHPAAYPSLVLEAQGDCYAGAFLAWVVAGAAPDLHLPAASLLSALAPLLDFADPVDVKADDPAGHGLALDRLTSALVGLRSGPVACHRMVASSLHPTLGRPGLITTAGPARFGSVDEVLVAARASVAQFARGITLPGGAGSAWRSALPQSSDLAAARPYGQFATAAAQALATGRILTGTDSGAACFTGAWAASVYGHAPPGALGSWAGDADEALNVIRTRPGATFPAVAGYADGFDRGWAACAR